MQFVQLMEVTNIVTLAETFAYITPPFPTNVPQFTAVTPERVKLALIPEGVKLVLSISNPIIAPFPFARLIPEKEVLATESELIALMEMRGLL